jgi:hypothetical protein
MIADAPKADRTGKVVARMSRVKRIRPDWRGEEVIRTVRLDAARRSGRSAAQIATRRNPCP